MAAKKRDEESSEEEEEYEVESILGHRGKGANLKLLVRWKGYTKDDDSWEPEAGLLVSAKDIVDQYYTSIGGHPSKPVSKPVSSKTEAKPVRAKGRPSAAKDGSSEDEQPVQKKKPGRPPKRVKEADDEEVDEKRTKRARSTSKAASPGKPKSNGVAHEAVKQVEEDDLDDDDDDEEALRKMRAKEEREQKKLDAILKSFKGDWEIEISQVRTVKKRNGSSANDEPRLLDFQIVWGLDSITGYVPNEKLRKHAPKRLLDFYEEHLRLKVEDEAEEEEE